MTANSDEAKRRLEALLHDSLLVEEYLRRYGPVLDIRYIKAVKDSKNKTPLGEQHDESGEDPIYEVKVRCPACRREMIPSYELRAKSQQITRNKFLVPCYEGTLGYRTTDYTYLNVTVCPKCLFASPDRKDFIRPTPDGHGTTKCQIPGMILATITEKAEERREILGKIDDYDGFFRRPRSDDAAIASYRLALARAAVEAWYEQPYAHYKMGAYALKIAKIIKDGGVDNKPALVEAMGYMEEAFKFSTSANEDLEMQILYSVVALALKLGDQKKAAAYLGAFSRIRNDRLNAMQENPKLTTVIIDRWHDRAQRLWEDRDLNDLFTAE